MVEFTRMGGEMGNKVVKITWDRGRDGEAGFVYAYEILATEMGVYWTEQGSGM